jgi:hypothetical protein
MKLIPLTLVLVVLAGNAATAGASSSRTDRSAASAGFCGVARGVAREIVNSTSISKGVVSQANIRTTYLKIAAAEPALLSSAPAPVKADLRPVFRFVNVLIADFKKANWSVAGLAPYMSTLVPRAEAIQPQLRRLRAYFKTTCKLDV